MKNISVTIWNEFIHERESDEVKAQYPSGIHETLKAALSPNEDFTIRTATLDMPEHGLTEEVLDGTDVLVWWGHIGHDKVDDKIVERVYQHVQDGMGLIVLHSGHASKIFTKLCGTRTDKLKWRESNDKQIIWIVEPQHPIAQGLPEKIVLEHEETYGERFEIPAPDELVFISWFSGGEVFRSGCVFNRGRGKIFYFQPGHETLPSYHNAEIQKVIANAVRYTAKPANMPVVTQDMVEPTV